MKTQSRVSYGYATPSTRSWWATAVATIEPTGDRWTTSAVEGLDQRGTPSCPSKRTNGPATNVGPSGSGYGGRNRQLPEVRVRGGQCDNTVQSSGATTRRSQFAGTSRKH